MSDDSQRQEESRKLALTAAQSLERRGLIDAAQQAFLQAGAPEETARLMISQRRFGEAAKLLMETVAVPPESVGTLEGPRKKMAFQAAICFGRSNEPTLAATLFLALGERDRAIDVLRKAGDLAAIDRILKRGSLTPTVPPVPSANLAPAVVTPQVALALEQGGKFETALDAYLQLRQPQHAARMAARLGRMAQAGELFVTAGLPYEAAECFWRAGDSRQSLDALMRVPRDDQRYRQSCQLAIKLASDLDVLEFQLDHFITKFMTDPPQDERDAEAFYLAARLYQRHDHLDNAREAYRKIVTLAPGYRDARARLDEIDAETRGSPMVFEQILREEEAFRGTRMDRGTPIPGSMPDLPPLPDLPELPTVPISSGQTFTGETVAAVPPSMRSQLTPLPRKITGPPLTSASRPVQALTVPSPAPPISVPSLSGELSLAPGSIVADRYRLEAVIGRGGMATVFRAQDLELNEQIALKVFSEKLEDEQLVARFKQELSLSRQLHHPNIIRLYDIGYVQGFRYLSMELLSGSDLKSKLGKPIDVETGVGYLLQCCAALQHVHDRGVVHRDIKPANLFLTDEGVVKLMDFGIAKRQATPGLTVAGMIAGTPEYMSPEQINGFEKVTASTDLYALGIMAYEIFTGSVPFKHKELMPLLLMQMKDPPPPPRTRNPDIPPDLEEIILKLLEKDPARRFPSCSELAGALQFSMMD